MIQDFVRRGGGYMGICAGSYLATAHYSWSLGILNARVWDRAHWARGTGSVALHVTPSGNDLFTSGDSVEVYYGQGPLLVPGHYSGLPSYEVLARYETEIAKKGAPDEAMVGTHAIVRSHFGKGPVLCISPHPEKPSGPNSMIVSAVSWLANNSAVVQPSEGSNAGTVTQQAVSAAQP